MEMKPRQLPLERADEVHVEPAIELRREPRLDTDLGGPQLPRLPRAPDHLLDGEEVPLLLAVVPAEGAERAVLDADVREVDVPVHDVGDDLAHLPPPELVGDAGEGLKLSPARLAEDQGLLGRDLYAVQCPIENPAHLPVQSRYQCLHRSSSARTSPSAST